MAILKVARMGHPVLISVAAPLDPGALAGPEVQRLIGDMIETMRDEGGVGLAAPQVHHSLRLFVMEPPVVDREDREGDPDADASADAPGETEGPVVLVNPVLTFPQEETMQLWEGCLSMPGIRGRTQRWRHVHVEALDRHGRPLRLELEGFGAAVVQHETDHLDGILFPARMPNPSELAFEDEMHRHAGTDDDDPDGD